MVNVKDWYTPILIIGAVVATLIVATLFLLFSKGKDRGPQSGASFIVAIDQDKMMRDALEEVCLSEKVENIDALAPDHLRVLEAQAAAKVNADLRHADEFIREVLLRRLDALAIDEVSISITGEHRFSIQIAGATAEQCKAAEKSVSQTSFLELRLVARENEKLVQAAMASNRTPKGYERVTSGGTPALAQARDYLGQLAQGPTIPTLLARFGSPSVLYECVLEYVGPVDDDSSRTAYRPMYLSRAASTTITGDSVIRARADKDSFHGGNVINVEFNRAGSDKLARISAQHTGEQMAIVLDDIVRSAPVLREPITGGHCQISGDFTWEEANRLAGVFNAGALNIPLKIVESHFVSPDQAQKSSSKRP